MSMKVVPFTGPRFDDGLLKPNTATACGERGKRSSRVFKAVNDVYEFRGWQRQWISVVWFILMYLTMFYTYPDESGPANTNVMSLMTSYVPSPGANNADVRDVNTFGDGLSHALGFISAYVNKAVADGQPEGSVTITEYDKLIFARLELDFKSNCNPAFRKMGFACYKDGLDPTNGTQIDPDRLTALAGPDGVRQVVILDKGVTRDEALAQVAELLGEELMFMASYAYEAVLELGVQNSIYSFYRGVFTYTIGRKDHTSHVGAFTKVLISIDTVPVRSLPLYSATQDYVRAVIEVVCLLLLAFGIWEEVLQYNVCRAWTELHLSDEQLRDSRAARRRMAHVTWLYYAQPSNVLDTLSLANYSIWWIAYIVLVIRSYCSKVRSVETLADYNAMKPFAETRFSLMIWGIFTIVLIGLRILPTGKTHASLRIFINTLKKTWAHLKDMIVFFSYVAILVVALIGPLFQVTGANISFADGSNSLLNIALIAFGNFGYQDYFANNAPTFGGYKTIFMLVYWFTVIILFVISQNVLLALVAAAYDESREAEGDWERSYLATCGYRLFWIVYNRWHRWVLRKTRYGLLEQLLAAVRKPNAWWFQHLFVRWAAASLPESQLLAQLYIDPASELLYLYSPWAWSRASPWDSQQMAPWDEQLGYPMYSWADVPRNNSPGARPRLLRLPPLFTSKDGGATRERMPVLYNDADDVFALTEDEVDDLLDCVEAAWQRMRRNALVARCTSLGWSQRGRGLVREVLLEVYRRHRVAERTTSSVQDLAGQAEKPAQEPHAHEALATVRVKSAAALGNKPSLAEPKGADTDGVDYGVGHKPSVGQRGGDASVEAAAVVPASSSEPALAAGWLTTTEADQQRGRRMTFFNRRGRIADSLDLLWTELSELRQQQAQMQRHQEDMRQQQGEIKALLQALVSRQQQAPGGSPAGGRTGGSGAEPGGGGRW